MTYAEGWKLEQKGERITGLIVKLKPLDGPVEYIRVIAGELSRISDHLTCITASLAELGGLTTFFWGNRAREHVWELLEDHRPIRAGRRDDVEMPGVLRDAQDD